MKHIAERQLKLAQALYGTVEAKYSNLLESYERLYSVGLVTKHHAKDGVLFIGFEGIGFKAIKFKYDYTYKGSAYYKSPSDAYTEALDL